MWDAGVICTTQKLGHSKEMMKQDCVFFKCLCWEELTESANEIDGKMKEWAHG